MTRALDRCRNIADLRALAQRRMPAPIFHYVDGGAEDEVTLRRNTRAFDDYELEPEYAVDVSAIDTSATILGQRLDWPVVAAPTGLLGLMCAAMLAAFISTHDTYLHSWGSILVQDVILPFRRKPFTPRNLLERVRGVLDSR